MEGSAGGLLSYRFIDEALDRLTTKAAKLGLLETASPLLFDWKTRRYFGLDWRLGEWHPCHMKKWYGDGSALEGSEKQLFTVL